MRPQEDCREYVVALVRGDEQRYENIVAASRAWAADMCESRCPGWAAVTVTRIEQFDVAGRCDRCRAILFADQRLLQLPAGVRCADC